MEFNKTSGDRASLLAIESKHASLNERGAVQSCLDAAIAGDSQARIDAENAHGGVYGVGERVCLGHAHT